MKKVWQKLFLITFPLTTFGSLAPITSIKAQITPDNTLGAESSVVNRNLTIRNISSDRIDGGARRGNNLFHSFQEFNVGALRGAYFSNPTGVDNILTRVTGSNASNISGRLGVLGNANLFLINPNGIVFGRNASLDVRGSFFASTASSLIFNNGFEFSAVNPQAPPLLTVNIPIGLRFRDNPGGITVNGIGQNDGLGGASNSFQNPTLAVDAGKTLALVGGNVSLNGGVLQAPGGLVELGGLTAAGTVGINNDNSLSFPDGVARSDVALTNQAGINVITNALSGGSININARNIGISQQSLLSAGIASGLGEVNYQAGDITLNGTGETTIDQSRIRNNLKSETTGNNGNININAGSLSLTNGSQLNASTSGQGNAGNINVQANGTVSLTGGNNTGIFSNVNAGAVGNGGTVSIDAGTVAVNNGVQVNTLTRGRGDAGSVTITARDAVSFNGTSSNGTRSAATSNVEAGAMGNGGSVSINAGSLSLTNGGQLAANVREAQNNLQGGQGVGGDVNIKVRDALTISDPNSGVFSTLGSGARGGGGSINIQAGSFSLANDGQLNASTSGTGNAGNINVQANGSVSLTGGNNTGLFSNVYANAVGNGGTVSIDAGTVAVNNGAQVNTLTRGRGDAGSVTITARDAVSFNGTSSNGTRSAATSNVEAGAMGNGGSVSINAGSLSLTNGGQLAANVREAQNNLQGGQGVGGDVNINVRDALTISDPNSGVFSTLGSGARGGGGSINIQAGSFSLANDGQLNASTSGQGNAGSINVQTNGIVSLTGGTNNTGIFSNVNAGAVGNGGTISIDAGTVAVNNGAQVNTLTRGRGDAGSVTITARDAVSFNGTSSNGTRSAATSNVAAGAMGNGGSVSINAGSLSLTNGGQLAANVREAQNNLSGGQGVGGNVNINVRDALTISDPNSGVFSTLGSGARGGGGSINIQARSFSLANGGQLNASTSGTGNAGNINVQANGTVSLRGATSTGIFSNIYANAVGNGGTISIDAGTVAVNNGAQVNTLTRGRGDAGSVTITARDAVSFNGTSSNGTRSAATSNVEAGAMGNGGSVSINAGSLSLTNGGQLAANVREAQNNLAGGQGIGGDVNINVRDAFTISGVGANNTRSDVSSSLGSGASGSGGNIYIHAGSFSLTNNARLIASTSGTGNAGNINVQANGTVSLIRGNDTTGIFSNVNEGAMGNGGTISIDAGSVNINRGAQVNALTRGHGDAGNVTITARDAVSFIGTSSNGNPSAATSNVEAGAIGNGGSVSINAGSLSLTNGGQLGAIVREAQNNLAGGQGIGGDVNINVRNAFTISGVGANNTRSGVFSRLGSGARGRGGNIIIQAGSLSLANQAQLNASSSGDGDAGNINITDGELLLRSNSTISTSASTAGNGGNITINAPVIVAFPSNNDITANASSGIGGQVTIKTQGLFGIAPLSRTELERRLNMTDPLDPSRLPTSDITAISQQSPSLNGTVYINSSYVDTSQSLVKLPENVVDSTRQIAQNPCQQGALSSFAITGRGGIPSNPNQTLASENVRVGLVTPASSRGTANRTASIPSNKPTVKQAVPVQGWVFNDKGQVVLTAYDPTLSASQRPWRTPASCAKQ